MATDIFRLLGTISIDMTDFNTKMDNAMQRVNNLATAINNLNGTTANVTINQAGTTTTPTGTNTAVTPENTGDDATTDSTDNGRTKGTIAATVAGTNQGGWTVVKGILANLGTQAINWGVEKGKEFYWTGINRVNSKDSYIARLKTTQGFTDDEAEAAWAELDDFVFGTPLNTDSAVAVANKLLATGVDYDDVLPTMQLLGDLAIGDSNVMTGLAGGYTDVMATGVLTAQDARQFTSRGIALWDMMADYYNSEDSGYQGRYRGMWESGSDIKTADHNKFPIPAEDFQNALKWATSENGTYHNAMLNVMDTYAGRKEQYEDSIARAAGAFAEPIADVYKNDVYPVLTEQNMELVRTLQEGSGTIEQMAQTVGSMMIAFGELRNWAVDLVLNAEDKNPGATGEAAAYGGLLATAFGANPFFTVPAMGLGIGYDLFAVKNHADELGQGFWETLWQDKLKDDVEYFISPFKSISEDSIKENASTFFDDWGNLFYHHLGGKEIEAGIDSVGNVQRMISTAYGTPVFDFAYEHLGGKQLADFGGMLYHLFATPNADFYGGADESLLPVESLRKRRRKQTTQDDQYGAPPDVQTLIFDDGQHLLPATSGYSSLMVQLQNMPQQITAAVQEGMNGVTITATVTTGDVRLQDGALVGALTPKINMVLGAMNASSSRG